MVLTGEFGALDAGYRRTNACAFCGVKCVDDTRALSCRAAGCRHVAHIRCAFPGARVQRSALFSNYKCPECMDYELDVGIGGDDDMSDCLGGECAKDLGALRELERLAGALEAEAVAPSSHATTASGVRAFEKFWAALYTGQASDVWRRFEPTDGAESEGARRFRVGSTCTCDGSSRTACSAS